MLNNRIFSDQEKSIFWQKELGYPVEACLYQEIDRLYPITWNKDLAGYLFNKFNLKVSTAQLRKYAKKFGLTKQIDTDQKIILLLQRSNPDTDQHKITLALAFLKEQARHLTNQQVISQLHKNFGFTITYNQLANINRWLGLRKTCEAKKHGRINTMQALHKHYQNKHENFMQALTSYPDALTTIIASLLGDAELCPVNRGYAVFRCHHSAQQYHWLQFKASLLPPEPYFRLISYGDGSFSLTSQSNPFFSQLLEWFYRSPSEELVRMDPRKKREKYLSPRALELVKDIFIRQPQLALAVLIGDDGSLVATTGKNTVNFEYVIYCQGMSENEGLKLKQVIELATNLHLSITRAKGEYGIRLTITGIEQIRQVANMIHPYLSCLKEDIFWKKYDLLRHIEHLSKKHNRKLTLPRLKNHWTQDELEIIHNGITQNQRPAEIHRRLMEAGFNRTYHATYNKWKEINI